MRGRTWCVLLLCAVALGGEDYAARLRDGDWVERNRVIDALFAEDASVAVPLLTGLLDEPDSFMRRRAAQALALFGEKAAPAVPGLIQMLYDESSNARMHAATALQAIGEPARAAWPFLREVAHEEVRPFDGIRTIPQPSPGPLAAWTGNADSASARYLARLEEGLKQDDVALRAACAKALGRFRRIAAPALREAANDESWEVAGRAAEALGLIHADDEESVEAVARLVERREWFARRKATQALAHMGTRGHAALVPLLEKGDPMAAEVVARFVTPDAANAEAYAALLVHPRRDVRVAVARALARSGEDAAPAVPALAPMLAADDKELAVAAAEALGMIGPAAAPAVPELRAALRSAHGGLVSAAAHALSRVGAAARPALPDLLELLREDPARAWVLRAVAACGPDGRPALLEAMNHADFRVRLSAMGALFAHRHYTPEVHAALRKATADAAPRVARMARDLLERFPSRDDTELPAILKSLREAPLERAASFAPQLVLKAKPETLARLLDDDDVRIRLAAAYACNWRDVEFGDSRAAVINALARRLDDAHFQVRTVAAGTLARLAGLDALDRLVAAAAGATGSASAQFVPAIVSLGAPAVPRLTALLGHDDLRYRRVGVNALGGLGPTASAAIPRLVKLLADPGLTPAATNALAAMGLEAAPHVIDLLRDPSPTLRRAALRVLKRIGSKVVPLLQEADADPDAAFRVEVVHALSMLGAGDALALFVADEDRTVRDAAVRALAGLTRPGAVGPLLGALADEDARNRAAAAQALGRYPTEHARVVPALAPLLRDADASVREAAAYALGRMGEPAQAAIDRALASTDRNEQLAAVTALQARGAKGVPHLARLLTHERRDVRVLAVRALGGRDNNVPHLVTALDDKDVRVRQEAARALRTRGAAAVRAVPRLIELLDDRKVRSYAVRALVAVGPGAVPHLLAAAKDERTEAVGEAFKGMSAKAVPDLIDALAATAATKRRTAAWAIGTIGPAAEAAVPALIEALDDKGAFVASQVAWALGRIGPGARPALPKLRALRDDPGLREVAKDAIGRIDKR